MPVVIEAVRTNNETQARLSWPAEADRQYSVLSTTDLGNLSLADPVLVTPTNLIGEYQHSSTNRVQFFRVTQRDIRGPEITSRYPATNGVGVGRFATLTLAVADETGLDTNRFALTFKGATLTNGSPGVTVVSNGFQYVPGTNAWGDYGSTAVVSFVCSDLLGNVTFSAWAFTLEVQPVVTNVLLHLPPPPSGMRATLENAATQHGVTFLEGLTIISFETNRIGFTYTGESHGLYSGAILVSHDPARVFYRRIISLSDDPPNYTATANTIDVLLTDIVQDGSFSPEVFVSGQGVKAAARTVELGYAFPFSYVSEFTVLPIELGDNVRITPGILSIDLRGKAEVSCVIKDWQVVAFDASIESQLAAEIRAQVELFADLASFTETKTLAAAPVARIVGFIGVVPVWVELQLAVDLGLEIGAEGAVVFDIGLDAFASSDFQLAWLPGGWNQSYNGTFDLAPVPLDVGFQLSVEAFLYLKPRLSALVYSLAGVSADYRRGPALEAVYEPGQPQCEITLYDKWSINAGMSIVGIDDDDLPHVTFLEEKRTIQTWYWPEIAEQAPVFTRHPTNVTAAAGTTVTLEASATGNPAPSYQWFQNGIGIPFQTQSTLTFTMSSGTIGTYHVIAQNHLGWIPSNPATVSLLPSSSRPGMVWIPLGTFTMGSPDSEIRRKARKRA